MKFFIILGYVATGFYILVSVAEFIVSLKRKHDLKQKIEDEKNK